jgi:hypothetical protein
MTNNGEPITLTAENTYNHTQSGFRKFFLVTDHVIGIYARAMFWSENIIAIHPVPFVGYGHPCSEDQPDLSTKAIVCKFPHR